MQQESMDLQDKLYLQFTETLTKLNKAKELHKRLLKINKDNDSRSVEQELERITIEIEELKKETELISKKTFAALWE